MIIRTFIFIVVSSCVLFSGCTTTNVDKTSVSPAAEPLVQPSWLSKHVPENAYAYIRIPNSLSFFSAGDDAFTLAQNNSGHNTQVRQLHSALSDVLRSELPEKIIPIMEVLTTRIRSPLEMLVFPIEGTPLPYGLLTAQVDFANTDDLNQFLNELVANVGDLSIKQPFTENNQAILQVSNIDIVLKYQNQSLLAFTGLGVRPALMEEQLQQLSNTKNDVFLRFESRVDSSGIGAIAWVNTASVIPIAQSFAPEQAQQFSQYGLKDITSIAIGMGAANGKGRLRMSLTVDNDSDVLKMLSIAEQDLPDLKTVGEPQVASLLRIPTKKKIDDGVRYIFANDQEKIDAYEEALTELQSAGFQPLEYFDSYGDILMFKDDLGVFAAQHIRNKANYREVIAGLSNSIKQSVPDSWQPDEASAYLIELVQGHQYTSHSYKNQTIHELTIPSLITDSMFDGIYEQMPPALIRLIMGGQQHSYWIIEDNYIVYAELPQQLMERIDSKKTVSINEWRQTNGLEQKNSLFALNGAFDGGQRKLYNEYLQLLTLFADSVDAEFDIFAFPSASDLMLTKPGVAGLQLDSTSTELALELTYEKTPFDALLMADFGVMYGAMGAGILAAVALPAYQDYQLRAVVSNVLIDSQLIQDRLSDHYQSAGGFPDSDTFSVMTQGVANPHISSVDIEPKTGLVEIMLQNDSNFWGESISLTPYENDRGGLDFICESTLSNKYLPAYCR